MFQEKTTCDNNVCILDLRLQFKKRLLLLFILFYFIYTTNKYNYTIYTTVEKYSGDKGPRKKRRKIANYHYSLRVLV